MSSDFSEINLQYLLQARDLARQNAGLAGAVLGLPGETVELLGGLTPKTLAAIARVQAPLITLLPDRQWWSCLLTALKENDPKEIEVLIAQAPVIVATSGEGGPA